MIRNAIGSIKVILLTYAVTSLMGFALVCNAGALTTDEERGALTGGHAALISKAVERGTVRVIVGVDERLAPDQALSEADTPDRRAAIAGAQDHILSGLGLRGLRPASVHKYKYIPYMAMSVDSATLKALASSSRVVSIQEDVPARVNGTESWNMQKIGASILHTADVTGAGMAVAILDTGVDGSHPYLAGAVVSEACYSSNFTDTDGNYVSLCPGGATDHTGTGSAMPYAGTCPAGQCDHGTHVAGIVAGRDNVPGSPGPGVAPGASVIAIQVFTRFESEFYCAPYPSPCVFSYMSDRIKGLERVYELRDALTIASVNMSFWDLEYSTQKACEADNKPTKAVVDNLKRAGIATIASSGMTNHCGSLGAPACISSVISVGATDSEDKVDSESPSASFLTFFAPGITITSSVPGSGYATWSGASMAAPHVAGSWALVKQRRPTAAMADILKTLTSTGRSVTDSKCTKVTKKRINVFEAYNYPPPAISVSPASLNFGSVKIGESTAKTLTIKNTGPTGCSSLDVNIAADPAEFSFSPASCPPLARGESCSLSVKVTPQSTYGSRTGTLTIASDASNKSSLAVKLSANAVSAKISAPASLSFPAVAPPGALVKSVIVKNTGVSDLVIGTASKTGDQFEIGPTNTCAGQKIIKGGSCTIDVKFTPDGKAKYAGSLIIPSNDQSKPTATVALKGSGK